MKSRQIGLTVVAVVLFAVAAALAFRAVKSRPRPPERFTIDGVCLACGKDVQVEATVTRQPPLACPLCGKEAVYKWMYCPSCRRLFIPNLVDGPDGRKIPQPFPPCTGCGEAGTMAYDPILLDSPPVGRVPLPKWPPG